MAAVLLPVCKGGGGREGVARERLGSEGARREALAHNRDGRIRMRMRMVCAVVQSRRRSEVRPPTRSLPPFIVSAVVLGLPPSSAPVRARAHCSRCGFHAYESV